MKLCIYNLAHRWILEINSLQHGSMVLATWPASRPEVQCDQVCLSFI